MDMMSRASGKGNEMKKPEEIKKNLKGMASNWHGWSIGEVVCDALAYIKHLEAQLGKKNNLIDVLEEENDENT
jgi:hypothetical protein